MPPGASTATIDLTNNFWGTLNPTQIAAKITDHSKNSSLPTVLYQPFLTENATATYAANASVVYSPNAQTVTLSATVISADGPVTGGTETFTILSGSTDVGTPITENVADGAASGTYTIPAGTLGGVYTIQAVFSGTSTLSGSSDSSHTLTIVEAATTTAATIATTTFSASNQTISLSATVTSSAGIVNEGTETFTILSGTTPVGIPATADVSDGAVTASYTLPGGTTGGTYTIEAAYNGTVDFGGSSDTSQTLTVSAAASATAAASASATYSAGDQFVALSATVTSLAGTVSEGTETFTILSGATPIGTPATVNVSGGSASASYELPGGTARGTYTIQAVYNGTTNFLGSSDNSHSLTISKAATTTAAKSATTIFSASNQTISLSATVTSSAGIVNEGTETFTVLSGTTPVGTPATAGVSEGAVTANYTLPGGTAVGTYTIEAVYNGTVDYGTSTDTSQSLTVDAAGPTITWNTTTAPTGGDWDTPGNWVGGVVPTASNNVVINLTSSGTVTHSTGANDAVLSLTTNANTALSIGSGSIAPGNRSSSIGSVTIGSGAALSVAAGASVAIQTGQTLTDNGAMTLASGDTLSLASNYDGGTQVVVNGTLTATGTTFNQPGQGYFTSLTVNSGGELIASGSTFALSQVTLSAGSVFNAGDLSNDAFNQPLYLPITDVPLLSAAGGGSDNKSFQDIDIFAGTLASGSTVNLNAIGTVSTANLRDVFPNGFTVASGATLNVGANVPILVQTGQTLTVNGAMTLASGDTLSLASNYDGGTQVVVNGTLTATGTTFNQPGQGYFTSLTVNSGGRLIASGSTFALSQVTLSAGSVFNAGDLSNDAFNQPLYLPITDVPLLSAAGGGSDNKSFQDIDVLAGTLAAGQTVNLNAIGTVSTANLRYVFPNGFTVASGATLNVGANVPILVQTGQTLTDNGAMTLASGDTLSLASNYDGGTQVVVNGTLTATGTTFNQPGQGYFTSLTVNSGGELIASGSTFALSQVTLTAGSVFNAGDLSNDAFNQPLYLPITDVPLLSAAGGGSDNKSFQDIDVLAGTLAAGQTVNLNAIGTVPRPTCATFSPTALRWRVGRRSTSAPTCRSWSRPGRR